jgi:crossover junction endodeoxyribonuclease RuvC
VPRILGIDPGSRVTGYAVLACADGRGVPRLEYVECGVITADEAAPLEKRFAEIARGLEEVIRELTPDVVAMEDVFTCKNARTALALGQARGAAMTACGLAGLRVFAYAPALVKQAVTGHGRAPKPQVASMVKAIIGLRSEPRADAADALAVAVAHAHIRKDRERFA